MLMVRTVDLTMKENVAGATKRATLDVAVPSCFYKQLEGDEWGAAARHKYIDFKHSGGCGAAHRLIFPGSRPCRHDSTWGVHIMLSIHHTSFIADSVAVPSGRSTAAYPQQFYVVATTIHEEIYMSSSSSSSHHHHHQSSVVRPHASYIMHHHCVVSTLASLQYLDMCTASMYCLNMFVHVCSINVSS